MGRGAEEVGAETFPRAEVSLKPLGKWLLCLEQA